MFLQTPRVKLRSENSHREVCALFDSALQSSYILKSTAQNLNYPVNREVKVVHTLFGDVQTSEQAHNCYDIRLSSLDDNYMCKFEVLDQVMICKEISRVYSGRWTKANRITASKHYFYSYVS